MSSNRPRQIVRRAVMALAVVVLLAVWYVSSYGLLYWCCGRQFISLRTMDKLRATVFVPADWYSETDYPGGFELKKLACWCLMKGRGSPINWELVDIALKSRPKHPWR